jgi:bifunctional non-homologous end joining protein LigD
MIRVAAAESGFLISPNRASAWSATDGETFHHCCKLGLEGIDAKRRDRPYRSGRSAD